MMKGEGGGVGLRMWEKVRKVGDEEFGGLEGIHPATY